LECGGLTPLLIAGGVFLRNFRNVIRSESKSGVKPPHSKLKESHDSKVVAPSELTFTLNARGV
jgi:hypothetical protein